MQGLINDSWSEKPGYSAFRVRAYGFADMVVHNASAVQFRFYSTQSGPDFPEPGEPGLTDEFWIFK